MRSSLVFKLMGAFLLVIAIGALVISWLVSRATQSAFSLYTTRNGQAWAQRLAPVLTDYYSRTGSWQGVEAILQSGDILPDSPGMMMGAGPGQGYGYGPGQGRGAGAGRQAIGGGMFGMMGQRLILVDGQGNVISDTQNELTGQQMSPSDLKNGVPLIVNNNTVGTLIVAPAGIIAQGTPAGEFLSSVNRAIVSSVVVAAIIALILGAALFFQITAPLRQLKKAAAAIAGGDLNQRVAIHSHDEFGDLGKTFNQMAASLSEAETQRKHLVADVAHELRTPLAAIQGTLEGMQDGVLALDEEQVTALYSETMLLNRLVGDLRLLSLAEAGQLKLEKQPADLAGLIKQAVEGIKPQASQKEITLDADIPAGLPPISVDTDRITQVMNNLIGNALRYTPQAGNITIKAGQLHGESRSIQISVTDSGPGIDPGALPYVFDRFYRADVSRSRESGGSGLGLAIVKQLIEAHGGTVKALSPVFNGDGGKSYGTQIIFTLPV